MRGWVDAWSRAYLFGHFEELHLEFAPERERGLFRERLHRTALALDVPTHLLHRRVPARHAVCRHGASKVTV